ncbi:MAG: NAD-dependent DNA ligase LigA [Lachnospiraceae bacterium]|nr:NAD-dependent DNA ligase LigA [Lachnospiraceae bacterium]
MADEKDQSRLIERQKELTALLKEASRAYYAEDREIMSNMQYDTLYDELEALERETGLVLADSPTVNVGYESVEELPKERHERRMLSLDKTKSREDLAAWLGSQEGLLSWKLDGLTVVLTYSGGTLQKAVTRGNGEIGEVITPNARVFKNIPLSLPFTGNLILRGEAVIRYSDFEKINEKLEEEAAEKGLLGDVKYKNPRNLCSGSVRQLNNKITAERGVRFYAFSLVEAEGVSFDNSHEKEFIFLRSLGFETVEYRKVTADTLSAGIDVFEEKIQHYDIPSDGLVLLMDDIAYGESLGTTAKFPRNAMAFKWADEQQETTLTDVEWSASRTGLINPVAIFEPVELEGTTVKRASVHNVSIVRSLKLGIGDRIRVYKANMIIPQISENLTMSDSLEIPSVCPVCGGQTQIRREVDTEVLICTNPDCTAKKIKSFAHFVSRNAMNIEGLSEMTLEKFIGRGFIHNFADIYHLEDFRSQIEEMEGFGRRSYENLAASIMRSRKTTLSRVLYAVGIVGIGTANARLICDHYQNDLQAVLEASADDLGEIEGIGPVLAASVSDFLKDEKNREKLNALLSELEIEAPQGNDRPQVLSGKTFVITGKVYKFENRDALKDYILKLGGKAAGSVSSNTDYLINNDVTSTSGKNKKAKQLGVPIISEDEFLAMAEAEGAE